MPKLWNDTIEAHRREVNNAILDTTARLVAEEGLLSVTMSSIAEETGIGRATLYKYFSDVESILTSWHERQIASHLQELTEIRDRTVDARERLESVLSAYASIQHDLRSVHATELAAHIHRSDHVAHGKRVIQGLVRDLVAEAAKTQTVRDDVSPDELATYCLHALSAARMLSTKASVRRLVHVTLAGLHPRPGGLPQGS